MLKLAKVMKTGEHWKGTCEAFCDVDVSGLLEWVNDTLLIGKTAEHPGFEALMSRHCMPSDLNWNNMGEHVIPFTDKLMAEHFPGCRYIQPMLSCLMAGQAINRHADAQPVDWIVRVHVPITSDENAIYWTAGVEHNMKVGKAYLINTKEAHECWNHGTRHRVHYMFDVLGPYGYGVQ